MFIIMCWGYVSIDLLHLFRLVCCLSASDADKNISLLFSAFNLIINIILITLYLFIDDIIWKVNIDESLFNVICFFVENCFRRKCLFGPEPKQERTQIVESSFTPSTS